MPTSKRVGRYASKELRDSGASYIQKAVAGSDLAQRPKRASTLAEVQRRRRKLSTRK